MRNKFFSWHSVVCYPTCFLREWLDPILYQLWSCFPWPPHFPLLHITEWRVPTSTVCATTYRVLLHSANFIQHSSRIILYILQISVITVLGFSMVTVYIIIYMDLYVAYGMCVCMPATVRFKPKGGRVTCDVGRDNYLGMGDVTASVLLPVVTCVLHELKTFTPFLVAPNHCYPLLWSHFLSVCVWPYSPLLGLGRFSVSQSYTHSTGLLGRGISPSQGLYLYTEQHKHRINAHRHPCLEWDLNPRSQRSSG
jgi:hypothetical protein